MNRVGRYEVIEKLGQGGMGTVYKAFDPLLTRVVAVKVISGQLDDNPEHRERFFREARAAAQMSHRNIITIYDLGEQDGSPFLAMEYLEGRDLDQRLHDTEVMSLARKLELALSISEGLAHAHACGLIHRDIKPANIFVTDDGVVKILDFGLARLISSGLTRSNAMVGTVNYMAPEQLRGERADHRADIFSFGVLLYELLGGRKPFQGDSAASTMYKILHDIPQALDELDPMLGPPLTSVVDRAMAKAREDRYQRMTDLLRDLEGAYEPLRGADKRVISRVEAALRPPSNSRLTSKPPEYDPDSSPTIADATVPFNTALPDASARSAAALAAVREPSQGSPARRLWPAAVLTLGVLAVAGWFAATRQAPPSVSDTPSATSSASTPATVPTPPEPPQPAPGVSAAPTPSAPASPEPAPPLPPAAPPSRDTRAAEARAAKAARDAEISVDRARATAALGMMDGAKAAAQSANARELALPLFTAAEKQEAQAREDLRQERFGAAAVRMEATATLFRTAATAAHDEAEARAARARAEEARRRTELAARPAPPPPAPAPPPAPRPEPTPAPTPAQPTAQEAVLATLRRYTAALEQRDIGALRAVWPGLTRPQQEAVEAEFANARAISVELSSPKLEVTGATATVTAVRHYSLRTRDGQQLRSDTTTTLTLRQQGAAWLIESVSHRPLR